MATLQLAKVLDVVPQSRWLRHRAWWGPSPPLSLALDGGEESHGDRVVQPSPLRLMLAAMPSLASARRYPLGDASKTVGARRTGYSALSAQMNTNLTCCAKLRGERPPLRSAWITPGALFAPSRVSIKVGECRGAPTCERRVTSEVTYGLVADSLVVGPLIQCGARLFYPDSGAE